MEATTKVILVEPNCAAGRVLQTYLNRENLGVYLVNSPQEALAHLLTNTDRPDLIMGEASASYELCRFVRQHETLNHIPIILFTPDCLHQKLTWFEAGANDYVVQPIQPRELLLRIKVLLAMASRLGRTAKLNRTEPCRAVLT